MDIEALKADTRRQLESRIHDIEGFYYLLEVMFRKMYNFAHLDIVNATVYATYQNNYGLELSSIGLSKLKEKNRIPVNKKITAIKSFLFFINKPPIATKTYCILMLHFIVLYLSIITLFSGEINPAHRPVHHGYRKCS